jgi:hypothetical protein
MRALMLRSMLDRLTATIVATVAARSGRLRDESAQGYVEYVLVITLLGVGVVLVSQWGAFAAALHGSLQRVVNGINSAGS